MCGVARTGAVRRDPRSDTRACCGSAAAVDSAWSGGTGAGSRGAGSRIVASDGCA